jgi:Fic family protein
MRREELSPIVRKQLRRLPAPYDSHYGVSPLPPPEESIVLPPEILQQHARAIDAMARVDTLTAELEDPYLVSRILPRREAVSSAAIEGTNSTLDELLAVEETADDSASEAAVQVRDYATALDGLLPRARAEHHAVFTRDLVARLHHAVMAGDSSYADEPGALRRNVVWIGGGRDIAYSIYNPTPPESIAAALAENIAYLRCEGMQSMTQSLITRMAIGHAHFEAVHPFRDGNGRVGRLLLPLMMAAEGRTPLYLAPYIAAHKPNYMAALKAAQQRLDWPEAIGFMARAITGTVDEVLKTRAALQSLSALWRARRKFRAGSAAVNAIDLLPHYPVLTIPRLAALLKVSFNAAAHAVGQLVEAGILASPEDQRYNRLFTAREALSVINRPFGETPVLPER